VKLGIEDFVRIGRKTPVLADLKPSGKYFMNDLVKIGGTVPLMTHAARRRSDARRLPHRAPARR